MIASCVLVGGSLASAADNRPFALAQKDYSPYMAADDPFGFPMKVLALTDSRYRCWGAGKDLFYLWCQIHAAQWLSDKDAYVIQQADPHIGNIGTYLADGDLGTLAFGMVDFDESARLPFQIELLQGIISLILVAEHNGITLSTSQRHDLINHVLDSYLVAVDSPKNATQLLSNDPMVGALLGAHPNRSYEKELLKYVDGNGRFFARVDYKDGDVKDILRPGLDHIDDLAKGLADAIEHSDKAKLFSVGGAGPIHQHIKDIALRTHVRSSGSQGLHKYLVLVEKPLAGFGQDIIFYFKQEILSAPERAGIIAPDPRPAGQRCAEDMNAISNPKPFFTGWCPIGKEDYWVTIREPWTEELETNEIKKLHDLRHLAHVWATAAGASHHGPGEARMIAKRATSQLFRDLDVLSTLYLAKLTIDYSNLVDDPRAQNLRALAERELAKYPPKPVK